MKLSEALTIRGIPDSYERQENIWLLEHILNIKMFEFRFRQDKELTAEQQHAYLAALARLEAGEPLAYILGSQPFWTLDLKVTRDTLVPRPDTEVLVETVLTLDLPEETKMVDLGTGTGAIALALASEKPHWSVLATDVYMPTLTVARENADKHGLQQVEFACGAWFAALNQLPEPIFDLIVSNPPYIDAEDRHMKYLATEPVRALVALKQGLADLETIIEQGKSWLRPEGWIVLEHGYEQAKAVRSFFENKGFESVRTVKDYSGNDRVTLGQLI